MTARISLLGRFVLALLIAVAAVLLPAAAATADVDDFAFDSFHADMLLTRAADGHAELSVTETLVARFPDSDQNRGIVRAIPDDDDGVPLHTTVTSVTSGGGEPLPYEVSERGGFIEVATGDDSYVRGMQTYVISYTQRDTIRAFADTDADEFYRDLNGTGWEQPFGEVSAYIVIDPSLSDALTGNTACYVGAEGSSDTCEIVERETAQGEPREFFPQAFDLEPRENVTVAIGFAPGTFVPGEVERSAVQDFATDAAPAFQAGAVAAIAASIAAATAALLARRRSRDAEGRGIIVAEYDPPREVSVVQAAHLVARPAAAVPAAIVDLAVTGHARVIAHDDAASDVSLEYLAPSPDDPARQRTLDAVFGLAPEPGRRLRLKGADAQIASRFTSLSASAVGELHAAGFTQKQSHRLPGAAFTVALIAFAVAVVCAVFAAMGDAPRWVPGAAVAVAILAGIVTVTMWRTRDRITELGAPVRDHLIGLRDYLQLAEADRIRMLQSPEGAERTGPEAAEVLHLYERLLPYAIIWGIEKEWAGVLAAQAEQTDASIDWYRGTQAFSSAQLVALMTASRTAASPPAPAWDSSGGSSFSGGSMGGGFSGGGAGGGGGGGR
ncbi:DUF2207 domain-containing protein [Microbacterium sp. Gd 4-13]|uniref:DUF2207 family protein n=1 Tax=Microbacterium sp. Gd 4-13 TaxID=2173179 RepID=UPI000D582AA0|nr:DUF2207 domain-containing protein [Microbacterium sp. Gd 4-13]PVW03691.1 DUF2207 domain-containing protein [Microbacterium sp. Gd 4-13]